MRLHVAGLCFTDATGIPFHYDVRLVVLSYLIASVGSYAALEMIERWHNASGAQARWWQLASAVTLGGSIWSMHFIAMLALRIGLPLTYAVGPTALSLAVAIGAAGLGLQIFRSGTSRIRGYCAGIIVGAGIATMHYVGMAGLRFAGTISYSPVVFSLSLAIGITAAIVALRLSLKLQARRQRAFAALLIGGAISSMHYTGMASAVFEVAPLSQVTPGLSTDALAAAVALTTLALIVCAQVFVATDRRLLAAAKHEAESLRETNAKLARANAELERGRLHFDAVMDNMSQGLTFFDADEKLIVCNRRYREIYHLSIRQTQPGVSLSEIVDVRMTRGTLPATSPANYLARRKALSRGGGLCDLTDELCDGRTILLRFQPLADGGWVATHEDVTDRRRAEASIVFFARHDALTRLPNRQQFEERVDKAVNMGGRASGCAVLCLDLDRFELINDTQGRSVGDRLLQAVADRLKACVREFDTVARLGGDEFAILLLSVARPHDVESLANQIITAFGDPLVVDGQPIVVGTSIGVTMAPGDGVLAGNLLKHAGVALYLAKREGRGTVRFFEPEMDARIQLLRALELDLRGALGREEFELFYQPVVDVTADKITGFEALLRWRHPIRGLVSPADFIGLAEETGMIVAIGEWALRAACLEAMNWPEEIRVAVNLSPVQFKNGNLLATVRAALDASGLRPNRLELEITESVMLQGTEATLTAVNQLHGMGIAVALDDFGTGYSSLGYLRNIPFDSVASYWFVRVW